MDYKSLLFDPIYSVLAVDAQLVVDGMHYAIRAQDKTSGIDVGDAVRGQTILPACVVKARDITALGLHFPVLGKKGNFVILEDVWYAIVTYRMRPAPTGENDGEIYLLLSRIAVVDLSPTDLIPGPMLDDAAVIAILEVITRLSASIADETVLDALLSVIEPPALLSADIADDIGIDLTMTIIDPDNLDASIMDDLGVDALLTVMTFLSASIADDLGIDLALLQVGSVFSVSLVDDSALSALLTVLTDIACAIADDTGLSATVTVTSGMSAALADDTGLGATMIVTTGMSAAIADDTGLSATLSVTTSLSAAIADDTGLAATFSPAWQLTAAIADDTGVTAALLVGNTFTALIVDDLGLAAALASPGIAFGAVNGSPTHVSPIATAAPTGITAGQLLIAVAEEPNVDSGVFTASSGWTIIQQIHSAAYSKAIAYRIADGTAADQITWSWANNTVSIHTNFSRWTGNAKSIGNSSVNTGNGTTATPTAIVASKGGSFMLDVSGIATGSQPASPGGWTAGFGGGSPNPQEAMSFQAVPNAGTSSGTPSTTVTSGNWAVILYEVCTF